MRPALAAILTAATLALAACGGADDAAPSSEQAAKEQAAARDAANVPLPPEQDAATAKKLEEDLKAWK